MGMSKAIYEWERKTFPTFRAGRVHRLRAKAIVYLASRHFKTSRPLVIGGRWYGGGTYHRSGKWIEGEYIARPTIRLTFGRCYANVVVHEFAHHLQFSETGDTRDTLEFKPYLIRVWRWLYASGIAQRIYTPRQLNQIKNNL